LERTAFGQWRDAVIEFEAAAEALAELSSKRGQGDRAVPLVVSPRDPELLDAVNRELAAREAVARTSNRLDAVRGKK
jgi:hypothetical protein